MFSRPIPLTLYRPAVRNHPAPSFRKKCEIIVRTGKSAFPTRFEDIHPGSRYYLSDGHVRIFFDIPFHTMTLDPVQLITGLGGNQFCGCLSNLGVLLWCSTAAGCLFSAAGLLSDGRREEDYFLAYSGAITLILMIDDFLLFHKIVFPRMLGIPDELLFVSHFLAISFYLYRFKRIILRTDFILLVLAFVFLGVSFGADLLPFRIRGQFLVEDGSKFLGIVSWMVRVCYISGKRDNENSY